MHLWPTHTLIIRILLSDKNNGEGGGGGSNQTRPDQIRRDQTQEDKQREKLRERKREGEKHHNVSQPQDKGLKGGGGESFAYIRCATQC